MRQVIIDGKKMQDKDTVHTYLQSQLRIPSYFGNNLDALWDALSNYDKPLEIICLHHEQMIDQLGNYGKSILNILEEAAEKSPNIFLSLGK
jgi:ribonuclease inhibitor